MVVIALTVLEIFFVATRCILIRRVLLKDSVTFIAKLIHELVWTLVRDDLVYLVHHNLVVPDEVGVRAHLIAFLVVIKVSRRVEHSQGKNLVIIGLLSSVGLWRLVRVLRHRDQASSAVHLLQALGQISTRTVLVLVSHAATAR